MLRVRVGVGSELGLGLRLAIHAAWKKWAAMDMWFGKINSPWESAWKDESSHCSDIIELTLLWS